MRKNGLRPRAVGALSVVAASLFLLLCLANYGQGGFEAAGDAPWHLGLAGWFVEVFGAGAFALVLLPLIWGLVVYFREDTPSLSMRAAGTVLLACSISMVSGLVQTPPELSWAGSVGEYTVALTEGLGGVLGGGLAAALAWAAALTLFMASFVWATDWWFHSLRKGPVVPVLAARPRIDVEPVQVELRDDDESYEREVVTVPTASSQAASALGAASADLAEPVLAEGYSVRQDDDRMLVRGPPGYAGVEFLPPSDELASPEPPEERFVNEFEGVEERVLDDAIPVVEEPVAEDAHDEEPVDELPVVAREEVAAEPIAEPHEAPPAQTVAFAGFEDVIFEATPATPQPSAEAPEAPVPVAEIEQTVDAPAYEPAEPEVTEDVFPEATVERPRSGIGLPDDSPFVDEFFTVDAVVDEVIGAGDGASADGEIAAAFGTAIPSGESPEARVSDESDAPVETAAPEEPVPAAPASADEARAVQRAVPVIVDELLFADAYDIVDDEVPAPIAARSAPPSPVAAEATVTDEPSPLDRVHQMQLDPLFHDAVDVVLEAGRGTAMTLQRRFGIGHGRGLRLLEQMETAGILAPEDDAGTREVRIERAEWEAFTGSRSA